MSGVWSSGTGMAGLSGAGLYLLLAEILKFSNQAIFMTMIPSSIIYIICVELSWRSSIRKPWVNIKHEEKESIEDKNQLLINTEMNININTHQNDEKKEEEEQESQWQQIMKCFMLTWYRNLMLLLVYVFEYVCSVGLGICIYVFSSTKYYTK